MYINGIENINEILLLGMGSVMKSLLELMQHENHPLLNLKMRCVCPEDIPKYIYKIKPSLEHIKTFITQENVNDLLKPFIHNKLLVIDLTVNVESIDIIILCKKAGALYINTSLETYLKDEKIMDPETTTLYYQDIQLKKRTKHLSNPVTIIHSMGMNPGSISSLVYYGIESYCRKYAPDKLKLLEDNKFNIVAKEYLDMIHISEFDNQQVTPKINSLQKKHNIMINSWSCVGFIVEALGISFVATNEPIDNYKKSKYNKRMYFSPSSHSMDCKTDSICLYPDGTPFRYIGRMITHFEVVSLSECLSLDTYIPKISYVYSPSPTTQLCLTDIEKNDYKEPQKSYIFMQEDIVNKNSFDSLGASLFFKDGRKFWCGTVLTNSQTQSILGKDAHTNATQLQISISVLTAIEWILENPKQGIITTESIPYKYILKRCIPYWGNFFCHEITDKELPYYSEQYKYNPTTITLDKLII